MLKVDGLRVTVPTPRGPLAILEDISFSLESGGTLGIVGESGSGKSMLALAIIGLLPEDAAATGRVSLDGRDLLTFSESQMRRVRGREIGMVFQEPAGALNPAMRVGDQIAEGLVWRGASWREARAKALDLMERTRIPAAKRRMDAYPHELSGGQRQRVSLAIALAPGPRLLIADEPTTALDATVQAEIVDLITDLVADFGMGLLLISHDFGIVAALSRRTLTLYAGTRVEEGETAAMLGGPQHPYTRALIAAAPRMRSGGPRMARLATIAGSVPQPGRLPPGCRFSDRCPHAEPQCQAAEPAWTDGVRCRRAGEIAP